MLGPTSSPAKALAQRLASQPEDPWLFHRPELDWSWSSWSRVQRAVLASQEVLAERGLTPGTRIALPDSLHPNAVAWCLAVLAQGLVAVPLPESELRQSPYLTLQTEGYFLPPIPGPFERDPSSALPKASIDPTIHSGSVVLRLPAGEREEVSFSELWARAEACFAGLSPAPAVGNISTKDIVVLSGSLADPLVQLLLTWSLSSAAALLLEPTASAYAPTVEWARPTLLAGTAESLTALYDRLQPKPAPSAKPWHRRPRGLLARPLDRLRGVVLLGSGAPAEQAAAPWQSLGLQVFVSPE